jgi:hypothetical protein
MTKQPRNFPRFAGVKAKPRLDFARASPVNNKRKGTVLTFTADTTWVAPAGSRILQRLSGKGADGKPESGSHIYVDGYNYYTQSATYIKDQTRFIYGAVTYGGTVQGSPVPSSFRQQDSEDANFIYYTDYTFSYAQIDQGNYVGPTTGGAATGFGQVFAGGPSGQPALLSTFLNVQIAAGTGYPIVVPLGGYITIEY